MFKLRTVALLAACTIVFNGYAQKNNENNRGQKNNKKIVIWKQFNQKSSTYERCIADIKRQKPVIGYVYNNECYLNVQDNKNLNDEKNKKLARSVFRSISGMEMFRNVTFTSATYVTFKEIASVSDESKIVWLYNLKNLQKTKRSEDQAPACENKDINFPRKLFYMKFASSEDLLEGARKLSNNSGILFVKKDTEMDKRYISIPRMVELYPIAKKDTK